MVCTFTCNGELCSNSNSNSSSPPGLVQRTVLRHLRRVDATSAVGAERCGQADHWHATMRPHLTGASPAALASGAAPCQLQDRHAGRWFIGLCPATSRATWLTTADSSPTPVSDDCVLPTLEHWSSVAHKALLATEHSLRQHLGSGTVCRLI